MLVRFIYPNIMFIAEYIAAKFSIVIQVKLLVQFCIVCMLNSDHQRVSFMGMSISKELIKPITLQIQFSLNSSWILVHSSWQPLYCK